MPEIDLTKLSWRQLGFQLDEGMRGSNPNLYDYGKLLNETRRRAEHELSMLALLLKTQKPPDEDEGGGSVVKDEPPPDQPPLVEKVADMTHRGPGI